MITRQLAPEIDVEVVGWLQRLDPVVHVVGIECLLDFLRDVQFPESASVIPLGVESLRFDLTEAQVIAKPKQSFGVEDVELCAQFGARLTRPDVDGHRFEFGSVVVPGIKPLVAAVAKRSMQIVDDTGPIPRRAKISLRIELMNQLPPGDVQTSNLRGAGLCDDIDLGFDRDGNRAIRDTLRVRDASRITAPQATKRVGAEFVCRASRMKTWTLTP